MWTKIKWAHLFFTVSKFVSKDGRVCKYLETYFLLPFISMEEERLGWDLSYSLTHFASSSRIGLILQCTAVSRSWYLLHSKLNSQYLWILFFCHFWTSFWLQDSPIRVGIWAWLKGRSRLGNRKSDDKQELFLSQLNSGGEGMRNRQSGKGFDEHNRLKDSFWVESWFWPLWEVCGKVKESPWWKIICELSQNGTLGNLLYGVFFSQDDQKVSQANWSDLPQCCVVRLRNLFQVHLPFILQWTKIFQLCYACCLLYVFFFTCDSIFVLLSISAEHFCPETLSLLCPVF